MKKEKNKFSWWDLLKAVLYLADRNKNRFLFWNIALILLFFYNIIPPILLGEIVDFFTGYSAGGNLRPFYFYTIVLGGLFAFVSFLRLSIKKKLANITFDIIYDIRVRGFNNLLAQSLLDHRDENTGAKAQKIENGTNGFNALAGMFRHRIFSAFISTLGMLIVFIFLSPVFIIFMMLYIIGFFIIVVGFNKKLQDIHYKKNIATEEASGSYIEGLGNILTIKSSGAEGAFKNSIAGREEVSRKYKYRIVKVSNNMWKTYQVFNGVGIAIFLFMVGRGVLSGAITVGAIVIFYSYLQQLIGSANDMLNIYSDMIDAKTKFWRMMPIFWDNIKKANGDYEFPVKWGYLEMQNAVFYYKKEEKGKNRAGVYDVNIKIHKHQKIGFAGKTGSGKSTMAKLLVGLYPLNSGKYLIDNINIYSIKSDEILNNISIVLQESEMFNFSFQDNITLMREYNPELFKKAVKVAQLEGVIKKLPQGVDTLIGEKGYFLSGGERQRVGIARAVYRDTDIIIFDEATSSVDNKTEAKIQEALENELKKKTMVFIAHRVSTLKNVDIIYVFKDSRIVERGSYDELLGDDRSEFRRLVGERRT